MGALIGNEFVVIYDGSTVGYATDYSLSVNKKRIDVTTLASGRWGDSMVGSMDWSFDFSGLVSRTSGDSSRGYDYIMNNFLTVDASVVVAAKPNVAGNKYLTGSGFLSSVKMSGGVGDKPVTFNGTVDGAGPLTQATA